MDVFPTVKNWQFVVSRTGTVGTRTYISSTLVTTTTSSTVPLPVLHESWDAEWPLLTVKSINTTFLEGGCGQEYTVNYATVQIADYTPDNAANVYPQYLEINAETQSYNDNLDVKDNAGFINAGFEDRNIPSGIRYHWKWPDGKLAPHLPHISRATIMGYTVTRDLYPANLPEYMEYVAACVGKINDDTFLGIPKGLCKFLGADISESTVLNSEQWIAKLHFSIKSINGSWTANQGWQMLYNPVNDHWYKVTDVNLDEIYEETNLFPYLLNLYNTRPITPPFPGA